MRQMTRARSNNNSQKRVGRPTLSTGAGTRQCGGGCAAGQGAKNRACPVAFFGVRPKMGLKFRAKSVGQKPEHSTWSILLNIKSSDGHSAVQVRVCPRFRTGTLEHQKKKKHKKRHLAPRFPPGSQQHRGLFKPVLLALGGAREGGSRLRRGTSLSRAQQECRGGSSGGPSFVISIVTANE